MLSDHDVRAREHQPTFAIFGVALEPPRELVDHRGHLLRL